MNKSSIQLSPSNNAVMVAELPAPMVEVLRDAVKAANKTAAKWVHVGELVYYSGESAFDMATTCTANSRTTIKPVAYQSYSGLFNELEWRKGAEGASLDDDAYRNACRLLSILNYNDVPSPGIFPTGDDIVVFMWDRKDARIFVSLTDGVVRLRRVVKGQRKPSVISFSLAEDGRAEALVQYLGGRWHRRVSKQNMWRWPAIR